MPCRFSGYFAASYKVQHLKKNIFGRFTCLPANNIKPSQELYRFPKN